MVGILKYAIKTTTSKRSCSSARAIREWNSVISTSAETHLNPSVQIISLLDSFKTKKVSERVEAVYTFIFLFQK